MIRLTTNAYNQTNSSPVTILKNLYTKDTSQFIASLQLERRLEGFCLIIAPLLLASSTFYWRQGEYGVESATLLTLSLFFWIPALKFLFALVDRKTTWYPIVGYWIAVFGCISGVCFAFLGYLTRIFNIPHSQYVAALGKYAVSSQILLFASGPLFPLSLFFLGIILAIKKTIDGWLAVLLCLGAIVFPLSRISRVQWLAHLGDIILFIPCCMLAIRNFKSPKPKGENAI